jgi:GAF domain-containing protein
VFWPSVPAPSKSGSARSKAGAVAASRMGVDGGRGGQRPPMGDELDVRAAVQRLEQAVGLAPVSGAQLEAAIDRVIRLVPDLVGLSVTLFYQQIPFTVTATSLQARQLDAVQYLFDGPCVRAAQSGETTRIPDVLDEQRWQKYAQFAALSGVRSSLSVPLMAAGHVRGAVNLYAADAASFDDSADFVSVVLSGRPGQATLNADLGFTTRVTASQLPANEERLRSLNLAIGLIMQNNGWDAEQAEGRLRRAADLAGCEVTLFARLLAETWPWDKPCAPPER